MVDNSTGGTDDRRQKRDKKRLLILDLCQLLLFCFVFVFGVNTTTTSSYFYSTNIYQKLLIFWLEHLEEIPTVSSFYF
ncbi:unnamed protein product [Caenorhabditis angaria]|uniref:Uncharacterized protein n=1 Tax=Caenorhabditis angaria TaxID=860376 RepID=A0A9P1IN15_9PELO|nr:unnamed protein product [Caenorhabditis angaria]